MSKVLTQEAYNKLPENEKKKYNSKAQKDYNDRVKKLIGCCKKFEEFLHKEDDPEKWCTKFSEIFKEYLSSKKLFSRTNSLLKGMYKKLKSGKQNWGKPDYYKKIFEFKPKSPDKKGYIKRSAIDDAKVANYFNARFLDVIEGALNTIIIMADSKINHIPLTSINRNQFKNLEVQYVYSPKDSIYDDLNIKSHNIVDFKNIKNAFRGKSQLKNVTISSGVKEIPEGAFKSCSNLESITLPKGIQTIGKEAFYHCEKLNIVDLPTTVKKIDEQAFYCCKRLESVSMPNVETIGTFAFTECKKLESVSMPSATTIGTFAFKKCQNLKSINIPKTVKLIKDDAFNGCPDGIELIFKDGINDAITIETSEEVKPVIKYSGELSDAQKKKFEEAFPKGVTFAKI